MHRSTAKRTAAALAAFVISGVGLVTMAPPASAAPPPATIKALSAPTVLNADNQAAGKLEITLDTIANKGDILEIRVAPSSGDCATAEEAAAGVEFVSAEDDNTNVFLTLVDDCPGAVNHANVLELKFTDDVPATTKIVISKIVYDIGAGAPTFPSAKVRVRLQADGFDNGAYVAGNATIGGTNRIEGASRYATAGAIAEAGGGCADEVVVVSGTNFPDALAASYLGRPIILVEPDAIPAASAAAIAGMGAKKVTIVGGTSAVSSGVATALQATNEAACASDAASGKIEVDRIAGANRYATSLAVATSLVAGAGTMDDGFDGGTCEAMKTAMVVSGQNFPDALAAGPLASHGVATGGCGTGNIPVILTTPGALSPEAAEAINTLKVKQVLVVGGEEAVTEATEDKIFDLAGVTTIARIAGATRAETARDFADFLLDEDGGNFPTTRILVANGTNFPDALVAGPLGGERTSPILLSSNASTLGSDAADFIKKNTVVNYVTLLGGTTALTDAVKTQVGAAFLSRT